MSRCGELRASNKCETRMREFSVRIILSELSIMADSAERAEEIAVDILNSDARTQLSHGLCVESCEVDEQGPSDAEEETEVREEV